MERCKWAKAALYYAVDSARPGRRCTAGRWEIPEQDRAAGLHAGNALARSSPLTTVALVSAPLGGDCWHGPNPRRRGQNDD